MRTALLAAAALLLPAAAFAQVTNTTAVAVSPSGQPEAVATVTASQPVSNPPPQTTSGGPGTADPMYSGALKGQAFLDVDARIAAAQAKVGGNRKAMAMLNSIKGEAKVRRARHGGELRDWDREFLNKKLDALEGMTGA